MQHHTADDLPKAQDIYQTILQTNAEQPQALHLFGVIALQRGEIDRAIDLIKRATIIKPDCAEAHNNLGKVFRILRNRSAR